MTRCEKEERKDLSDVCERKKELQESIRYARTDSTVCDGRNIQI